MTQEQLTEIRERCDAATPGEWCVMDSSLPNSKCIWSEGKRKYANQYDVCTVMMPDNHNMVDIEFIAASRSDIPTLLDYIEQLQAELQGLKTRYKIGLSPEEYLQSLYDDLDAIKEIFQEDF